MLHVGLFLVGGALVWWALSQWGLFTQPEAEAPAVE
jgi:hypothetical protein